VVSKRKKAETPEKIKRKFREAEAQGMPTRGGERGEKSRLAKNDPTSASVIGTPKGNQRVDSSERTAKTEARKKAQRGKESGKEA